MVEEMLIGSYMDQSRKGVKQRDHLQRLWEAKSPSGMKLHNRDGQNNRRYMKPVH